MSDIDRLADIKEEILDLLDEAERIIRHEGDRATWEAARSYWMAHIKTSLTSDHDYLGGCTLSLEDTINELETLKEEGE